MNQIVFGDCRASMRQFIDEGRKVQLCVTSPPYFGLRSYMPDAVRDRFVRSHEKIFMFVKQNNYLFDGDAVRVPSQSGQQKLRSDVWTVPVSSYKGAHFATFPPALIEPCILAGSRVGDVVFDPFMGSGTTAAVAVRHGRKYLGCELNEDYQALQYTRIQDASNEIGLFGGAV